MVVIDAWFSQYPFPSFLETVQKRAAEFEAAHPGHRVNVRPVWWQRLPQEVSHAAAQGRPPAIASYYSGATQHARDTRTADGRPLFTSVERAIGGRTEILGEPVVTGDLVEAARAFYTLGGELVAMPLTLSTMLLYANTSLLRAAGVPDVPRTWSDVDAAGRALAAHGPSRAMSWVIDGKFFQHALAQQGGLFAEHHNGRRGPATTVDLTCPAMMDYVEWWTRLAADGHFLYTGAMQDWQGTFAAFTGERVALRLSSSFDAAYMVAGARENGFDIVTAPVPANERVPYAGNWIGGDAIWLADGLDEATRDGALAFTQFLNTPANAADWHKVYGSAPVTTPAVELLDQEGWFERHPYFRVATEQLEMMSGEPTQAVMGAYAHIQRVAMRAMRDVLTRDADPLARFGRATREAQSLLDDYHANWSGVSPGSTYHLHVDS
ncbi:extracellular solute-binding protein [Nonomuraea sp. MG754425]|uniref:extracellular solute-binding protein n=1 Tax=Nonomuraea sp. MG754425 TaxID=2570319 RepID=UPI001F3A93EF|nr:extracellular solute-binding protein [Nonomuraea sp. MG754425]